MRGPGKHALLFVFFTVLIDTIGFGIIMPVMPQLIVELTGKPLAEATFIGGWLLTSYALMQFVCGPIMGNLSDRFGRRPVLLASLAAFAIDYALMGFAPTLAWLFLGRVLAGVAGAVYSPAWAYVADVSPPEKRAQSFGFMGAAFGVGFVIGPAIGGFLGELGPRAPFFAAAALGALNFLYGLFVLPESLSADKRRKFEWKRANPFGTITALGKYPAVMSIIGALFLWQLAHQVYPATWSFFTEIAYHWTPAQIGASLAYVGVLMAFTQALLTGRVVKALGERRAVIVGITSGVAGMLIIAFSNVGWLSYVAMTAGMLQFVAFPSMNAIMSKQVPPDQQGELQGGVASLSSLTTIIGPVLLTQTLGRFSGPGAPVYFPGAPFLLAGILALCALVLVLTLRPAQEASPLPDAGAAG